MVVVRALRRHGLGNIESEHFTDLLMRELIPIIRDSNSHDTIHALAPDYNRKLLACLTKIRSQGTPIALREFTSQTQFMSFTPALFGPNFPLDVYEDMMIVDHHSYLLFSPFMSFFAFSAQAAQRRIRKRFVEFSEAWRATRGAEDLPGVSAPGNAIVRCVAASKMPPGDQGGAIQAFMWGVYTNTARVAYWLFAHLLCDRAAYKQLQDALDRAVAEEFQGSEDALLEAHPRAIAGPRFALLDSALKEAGRLHVLPSSYRDVQADVEFPA